MPLIRGCSRLFFNPTATTEIYTLSLHDALPISAIKPSSGVCWNTTTLGATATLSRRRALRLSDRKSTRLNSSHVETSYAVFCLKTKNLCKGVRRPFALALSAQALLCGELCAFSQ